MRWIVAAVVWLCSALAFAGWQSRDSNYDVNIVSGFTPSCTASTNWLARATNVTLTADKTNYDNLLCGLVTDGVLAKLDALYIYGAPDSTTAKLNLAQNAYNSTQTGSLTFTAYTGFTGDAATGYLDTGFNPFSASSPQFTQNASSLSVCVLSSRTTDQGWEALGTQSNNFSFIEPFGTFADLVQYAINSATPIAVVNTNAQGMWTASRTTSLAIALYRNGSAFDSSAANASGSVDNDTILVFASNTSAGPSPTAFTGDQQAAAAIGGALTATDAGNLRTRINTYLTAYSVSGC